MSTEANTNTDTNESGTPAATPNAPTGDEAGKTFTQADLDRIVQDRLAQQSKNKYGDYAELKAKAEGAKTTEERLKSLETELSATKESALRSSVAARFGVSTEKGSKGEPSDAELFLTGTDEATLVAQAERLAGREADRKKQGNYAPKEGAPTTNTGEATQDLRAFTKKLFNKE